jgi:hypothetical protein
VRRGMAMQLSFAQQLAPSTGRVEDDSFHRKPPYPPYAGSSCFRSCRGSISSSVVSKVACHARGALCVARGRNYGTLYGRVFLQSG